MTALVLGSFDREAPFRDAIGRLREAKRGIVGLWSPVPVAIPGQEEEAGARGIAGTLAIVGLAGAAGLYLLIWWSATIAYPFNSGGRPFNSWPAFLVAPVEFGALAAAIGGLVIFLIRARLTHLNDAAFELEEACAGTVDRFVIAVRCDAGEDANGLLGLMAEAGAVHSRVIER